MPIAAKGYIMTTDGFVVENDGKHTGVVFCGAGGTVSDDVAARYGIETVLPDVSAPQLKAVASIKQNAEAQAGGSSPLAPVVTNAPPQTEAATGPAADAK